MQKSVHFTLQGKGGVGKSLVSSLVAQYLRSKKLATICVDTDPVNATLMGYKSLEAQRLELIREGSSTVDEREFDKLMEQVIGEDSHFVVDNGAASFIALSNYLVENSAIQMIAENGKQVVVHTVVTGGQAMEDTLRGYASLAEQLPPAAVLIVWLNEFFGEIRGERDGTAVNFEEMKVFQKHKDRTHALVRIPKQSSQTFGKDVELMLDSKMTFAEIASAEKFSIMAKQRLKTVQKTIFDQLDAVL